MYHASLTEQTKKAVDDELHHIFSASYQLWHLEWYVWMHIPCLFILQFLLVWGSWYGQTRSYPRFFGYRSEQYVKLTSRVTANSSLILDISGIIAQVLDIMGLDVIPPSMLQFPFSLVPPEELEREFT